MIKCDQVKVIQLPYYDGLCIEDILKFAKEAKNGQSLLALPEVEKEVLKLPRAYIANVIYTIVGEEF